MRHHRTYWLQSKLRTLSLTILLAVHLLHSGMSLNNLITLTKYPSCLSTSQHSARMHCSFRFSVLNSETLFYSFILTTIPQFNDERKLRYN